jgi:response regulator RpfG family c-di-GMP phosphodiesterase
VVDRVTTGEYRDVRFTRDELKEIEYAAILHDIGKVGVREHILVKAKKLFDPELGVIRSRFDFIKRTLQYECSRRIIEVITRLGPEAARPQVKLLEEELERQLSEVDQNFAVIQRLNEPTVLKEEVAAHLRTLSGHRYRHFDGSLRPYLTDLEIGNLSIPKGSLNPDERLDIESHVTHSFRFLMQIPWTKELRRVPLIAYSHHERLDGSGYPDRLRGNDVPLLAQIMGIVDVFDALTTSRPYKPALPAERAFDELVIEAERGWRDRELVRTLIRLAQDNRLSIADSRGVRT